MSTDRHVVIIGGGVAGLAAAHTLLGAPDAPRVTLLERADRLGGKVMGTPFGGLANVECGADMFLARTPAAVDLATELGLADDLVAPAALPSYVWSGGQLHPLPDGLLLGTPMALGPLARSGLLTWKGKARAALEPFLPRYDAGDALGVAVRQRFGDEVLEQLVGPLVGGINAGDPDRLSLRGVAPQVAEALEHHRSLLLGLRAQLKAQRKSRAAGAAPPIFLAPRSGVSALVERLAASVVARGGRIHLGTPAEAVEPRPDRRWSVATAGGPDVAEADQLVLASPADVTSGLLAAIDAEAAAALAAIAYASVAMITVAVKDDAIRRPIRASGYLVPRTQQRTLAACSWGSAKWSQWRRPGQTVLRISAGHDGDDRPLHLDDADLTAAVLDDLDRQIGLDGQPSEVRITRWWRALPQYAPGHVERVDAVLARLAGGAPGIHLAGAAYKGLGIPACIAQGQAAARAALADATRS
jgi:oxygen-dependent protoporphyrinogen oxidase